MTKAIAKREAWAMPAGVVLDIVSLEVQEKLDFDSWLGIGDRLRMLEGGVMWWLGDWLRYGEMEHGEKYSQALDATDYAYQTLNSARWVADRIEPKRRNKNIPWGHHREVAAMDPKDQDKWLKLAEKESLTVKELRQRIHPKDEPEPVDLDFKTWSCGKVGAIVRAKNGDEAKNHLAKRFPGVKFKAFDLLEWPCAGEFIRVVGDGGI